MRLQRIRWLLALTILALSLTGLSYALVQNYLDRPLTLSESLELDQGRLLLTVEKGSNLNRIIRQLNKLEIIEYPSLFSVYAKLSNASSIKAGDYWIDKGDTAKTLLNKLHKGLVIRYKITFPEGWTFKQWINHLAEVPHYADIRSMSSAEILELAGVDVSHPEGWFFPDTYSYSSSDSASDILLQAHLRMRSVLDQVWQTRAANLPYKTAYEALIMASIIEKETGLREERGEIAGVFVRRLQLGMRLQTDPTVIYGMGENFKGNIRRRDLRQKTPYNTYRINGLPPTPIAMPSEAAIKAAVNPEPGSSLYFVARGDGGHQFSDTIEEHQKAVRHYQIKQRAKNYHSLPPQQ